MPGVRADADADRDHGDDGGAAGFGVLWPVRTGANPAPLFLSAWSNVMADAEYKLNNLYHSFDREREMGLTNRPAGPDAATDKEIDAALTEADPARRLALLRSAGAVGAVLLPMSTAPVVLASQADIRHDVGKGGSSQMTSAMRVHPR